MDRGAAGIGGVLIAAGIGGVLIAASMIADEIPRWQPGMGDLGVVEAVVECCRGWRSCGVKSRCGCQRRCVMSGSTLR